MLSIVIPSFNRRDQLLNLLHDIYSQEFEDFEVIVVDDNSNDDTVTAIAKTFKTTRILINPMNSGPAVCRNRGVRAAKGDFILGIDSDVTITNRNLFSEVINTFHVKPHVACLAFRILSPDGRVDDAARWCHPFPISEASKTSFTTYFSGTGFAIRRQAMLRAGLFPDFFYMHHEEVELAYRILDQGDSILYCPDLTLNHHAIPTATRSFVEAYYHPRNQVLLVLHSYPIVKGFLHLLPRTIFQLALAIKNGTVVDYCNAIVDAIKRTPNILSIRKPLKKETFQTISRIHSRSHRNNNNLSTRTEHETSLVENNHQI